MPVPNSRFHELLQDLEPSPTTTNRAKGAHTSIRNHLRTQAQFRARYVTSFLSGSYARDTSIRPQTLADGQERPDVDIIVVGAFNQYERPDLVLREVARALEDGGRGYDVERINKRSVRVETARAEMDIVPVYALPSGYMIADRETGSWTFTDPPEHSAWSTRQNALFGGRFKPLVKMFKWWRRSHPTGSQRPKGFVLEALVAEHAPRNVTHFGEAFAQMLASIFDAHGHLASLNYKPPIADPAVPQNDILAKVTVPQWTEFIDKVRVYADLARRAQDTADMEEATRLWQRVFGRRFRATANPARGATVGGFAAAAAPSASYSFPDVPATPPSKPRGFA